METKSIPLVEVFLCRCGKPAVNEETLYDEDGEDIGTETYCEDHK